MSIAETRSHFSNATAQKFAQELYGITASARPLPSDRDQNFHLKDESGQEFVLKIANAGEQKEALDFQNKAIEHLAKQAHLADFTRVRPTRNGEQIATVPGKNGLTHFVRLLTYLPGKTLGNVKPHTPKLLHSLGAFLGKVDAAFENFTHPAMHQDLKWDVSRAGQVIRGYLDCITSPERQRIVTHFLELFEQQVVPQFAGLRQSVIQNDGNDYNILVNAAPAGGQQVAGLIDFGDMLYSYPVYELAIAIAYAILHKANPPAAAQSVVQGYHAEYPLTEQELALLYPLICIRLCTSVTMSACQQQQEPDNDYLKISEAPAWCALEKLMEIPPQLAHFAFRAACNLTPSPQADAVERWLKNNASQIGPVVEPPLEKSTALILDLSVSSPMMASLDASTDTGTFSAVLFDRMRAANAQVGIGRYNEPRLVYTGDQFKSDSDELPEARTIHLGIDLFLPAESPVFAPLDGAVFSFQNNTDDKDYGPTIILEHAVAGGPTFYTLYGHLTEDSPAGLSVGMPVKKGQQIAKIGNFPTNGNWPPHLHFQIITNMLDYCGNFPGVALPGQREVWLSLSPDPNLILGIPAACFPPRPLSHGAILEKRRARLGRSLSTSYQKHLKIVRGSGQYLYDEVGRAYLDAVNNVPHVGHCHPHVVKAGQQQMATLNTNTRYLHDNLVQYAGRICATMPNPLSVCFFVCTGSEANDLALRMARTYTGQKDVIILDGAYHGNLSTLIEISPYKYAGPGGAGRVEYVQQVPMPDGYRGPYKFSNSQAGARYAAHVKTAIANIQRQGRNVAAFVAESLLGCGGQVVLPADYLEAAYAHVRAAGGVCLADEVQVGFGRVGTHFWGFETQGVVPDIVTLGKPIGNGHPLAAVVTTPEIAEAFNNGMEYFNTFGGNPVSCAIGMAVLDVIEAEQLQENARRVGARLKAGLEQLQPNYPLIGEVRGLGLFVGIELVRNHQTLEPAAAEASYIAERMRDHGILISTDGPLHNVLKIKPPLVFTEADADRLVATLDKILQEDAVQG